MTNSKTIKLPTEVIDSAWQDDIDYEPYQNEGTYISPNKVDKETIEKIKKSPVKLAIKNMVDWNKIKRELSV